MPIRLSAFLISIFLVISFLGFGQEDNVLETFEKEIPFHVFKTQDANLDFQKVLASPDRFKAPNTFKEKTHPDDIYWIQLDLENIISQPTPSRTFYLKLNIFDYGHVFYHKDGRTTQKPIGQFEKEPITKKVNFSNYLSYFRIYPKDLFDGRFLVLEVKRITFKDEVKNWHFTLQNLHPNISLDTKSVTQQVPFLFFTGVCFIMWFFSLSMYVFRKNREFLHYSLYLVAMFVYLTDSHFNVLDSFLNTNSSGYYWVRQSFLFISYVFYAFFLIYYLNTKKKYKILYTFCLCAVVLNVAIIGLMGVFYVFDYYKGLIFVVSNCQKLLNIYGLIACLLLLFFYRNTLVYIVVFATVALALGGLARYYWAAPEDGLHLDSLYYMIIGSSIEVIIFAFGLNYKANTEFRENFRLKEEALVNKTKALRAQINPHFIFNSLNSIQHLVTKNDKVSTLKYISKFGRLTRNILESSIDTDAILGEEIKILEDYLELESLRFDKAFSFKINVDQNLDVEDVKMPSMILQPFAENAIVHGLLPKKDGVKELTINFKKGNGVVICEVEDTGVGREVAKNRKHIYQKEKKSRGLEIIKQRLESLSDDPNSIKIIDKIDHNNQPLGTKVIIKVPTDHF